VTCTETAPDKIFIEAYKEVHVRAAIENLHAIFAGKVMLIPIEERPQLYNTTNSKGVKVEKNQWVRVKHGLYHDDLGLVYSVLESGQIVVRLIPRIDYQPKQEKNRDKFKKKTRPMQKLFNSANVEGVSPDDRWGRMFDRWNGKVFKHGLAYLTFNQRALALGEDVKPSPDEIELFRDAKAKYQHQEQSDEEEWKAVEGDLLAQDFQVGDMIQVVKGDLNGLFGKIKLKEGSNLTFVPEIDGLRDERFEVDQKQVCKHFLSAQAVRVMGGAHQGESGTVIKQDGEFVTVSLDQSFREIKARPSELRLKSESHMASFQNMLQRKKGGALFAAQDVISFDSGASLGLVLQVQEDFLKVLDEQNGVREIKYKDISKKLPFDRKASCHDQLGNEVIFDIPVKVTAGKFKDTVGIVKRIAKNLVFMWNKDLRATNGFFVEKPRSIRIQGAEHVKKQAGSKLITAANKVDQPFKGKMVIIVRGEWKGLKGIAISSDDSKVMVEIQSKCRKLPIDKNDVRLLDELEKEATIEQHQMGANPGKTPAINTPGPGMNSVYGQSEHWGGGASVYD